MTLVEELKSCPFCGNIARLWKFPTPAGGFGVECTVKGRACVSLPACFLTENDAIAAWNRRSFAYKLEGEEIETAVAAAIAKSMGVYPQTVQSWAKWKGKAKAALAVVRDLIINQPKGDNK